MAGDGYGNCYVLTADGTVGFVDTMKDPAGDRQVAGDLLSFMTDQLADDQDPAEPAPDSRVPAKTTHLQQIRTFA